MNKNFKSVKRNVNNDQRNAQEDYNNDPLKRNIMMTMIGLAEHRKSDEYDEKVVKN